MSTRSSSTPTETGDSAVEDPGTRGSSRPPLPPEQLADRRAFLARLPLFADLDADDLDRLAAMAEPVDAPAGQLLIKEGDIGDALYVVVDGDFEVTKGSGPDDVPIGRAGTGDVVGEMAIVEGMPRMASVRAARQSRVIRLSRAAFEEFITLRPAAALAVLRTVTARLRSNEAMLQQREKLASLGTLSAGLAHELNNPAAAVRRGADQLVEAIGAWNRAGEGIGGIVLDPFRSEVIDTLRRELPERAAAPRTLDALAASDRESTVEAFLESEGVDNAWEVAPALVAAGWDINSLDDLRSTFSEPGSTGLVLAWLGSGAAVHNLLAEVSAGAGRISELVRAVKTYTFMDQGPSQEVDLHEGLENTLIILRSKLKAGVVVERHYASDLPRIEVFGSELNQVWTNIIDNAIDAMDGRGTLTIQTAPHDGGALVEICDSGPGIPEEVQRRIFEPFFTTKEPGVGTGLGLHIAYNIVVLRHHGRISVASAPGRTCFTVTLPAAPVAG